MASIKAKIEKWKMRKWHQKAGDIFFWVLLVMLLIPGPRKFIATGLNKVVLNFRRPAMVQEAKAYQLTETDYIWDVRNSEGTPLDPESLRGEVVFLNFWGTYCPPCIAEMPEIQSIYDDYSDKVRFVLVSAESPEKVQNFLDSREYNLPSYYGGRNMPEAFSVRSVPTTFVISRDGKIVMKKVGAADWDSNAMRKAFDQLLES
jgi:thiol-disulfide isomerase/thioredoxin